MSLNSAALSTLIKNGLLASGVANEDDGLLQVTSDAIAESVVDHVVSNQLVVIPPGSVIIAVTGGSGAPAVGVLNPAPITCTVS